MYSIRFGCKTQRYNSFTISSPKHNELMKLFHQICEDSGIMHDNSKIFEYLYSFEEKNSPIQLNLFD